MILPIFYSIFFTSIVIFSRFETFGGLLGVYQGPLGSPGSLVGGPRAPMSSLPSIATLIPGVVHPPVQLGKFTDFFSLP